MNLTWLLLICPVVSVGLTLAALLWLPMPGQKKETITAVEFDGIAIETDFAQELFTLVNEIHEVLIPRCPIDCASLRSIA